MKNLSKKGVYKKIILGTCLLLTSSINPLLADGISDNKNDKGSYLTIGIGAHRLQNEKAKAGPDQAPDEGSTIIDIFETGAGVETGIGYDFGNIRTELTYKFLDNELKKAHLGNLGPTTSASGSVNMHMYLLNAYYDFKTQSRWKPYLGGGIGIGNIKTKNIKETTSAGTSTGSDKTISNVFSYQGKFGTSYLLNDSKDIFLEGVITQTEGFKYNSGTYDPATDLGVNVGLRHRF